MNQSDDDIFGRNIDQLDRETPRFNLSEEEDGSENVDSEHEKRSTEKKAPSVASVQPYSRASTQPAVPSVMSPHPMKKPMPAMPEPKQHTTGHSHYYPRFQVPVVKNVKTFQNDHIPRGQLDGVSPVPQLHPVGSREAPQHHGPLTNMPRQPPDNVTTEKVPRQNVDQLPVYPPSVQTPFMNQLLNAPQSNMHQESRVACYCADCVHSSSNLSPQATINSERQRVEDEILLRQRELDSCWQEDEVDCPRDFTTIDRKKENFYAQRSDIAKYQNSVSEDQEKTTLQGREGKISSSSNSSFPYTESRSNQQNSSNYGSAMKAKAKAVVSPLPRNVPQKRVNINTVVSQFSYSNDTESTQDYSNSHWPQSEMGSRIPSSERINLSPLCMSAVPSGIQTPVDLETGQKPLPHHQQKVQHQHVTLQQESPSNVPSATQLQHLPGHEKKKNSVLDKFKGSEQYKCGPIEHQVAADSLKDFSRWPQSEMGSRIPSSEIISLSPLTMSGAPSALPSGMQTPAEPIHEVSHAKQLETEVTNKMASVPADGPSSSSTYGHVETSSPYEEGDAVQDYSQFPLSELTSRIPSLERINLSPLCQSELPSGCQTPVEPVADQSCPVNDDAVVMRRQQSKDEDERRLGDLMTQMNVGDSAKNVPRFAYAEEDSVKNYARVEQSSRMQSYESLHFTPAWSADTSGIVTPCDHSSLYGGSKPLRQQPVIEENHDEVDNNVERQRSTSGSQIYHEQIGTRQNQQVSLREENSHGSGKVAVVKGHNKGREAFSGVDQNLNKEQISDPRHGLPADKGDLVPSAEDYDSASEIKNQQRTNSVPQQVVSAKRRNSWSSAGSTTSNRTDISTVVNAPTSMHNTAPGSPDPDGSEDSDSVLSDRGIEDSAPGYPESFNQTGSPQVLPGLLGQTHNQVMPPAQRRWAPQNAVHDPRSLNHVTLHQPSREDNVKNLIQLAKETFPKQRANAQVHPDFSLGEQFRSNQRHPHQQTYQHHDQHPPPHRQFQGASPRSNIQAKSQPAIHSFVPNHDFPARFQHEPRHHGQFNLPIHHMNRQHEVHQQQYHMPVQNFRMVHPMHQNYASRMHPIPERDIAAPAHNHARNIHHTGGVGMEDRDLMPTYQTPQNHLVQLPQQLKNQTRLHAMYENDLESSSPSLSEKEQLLGVAKPYQHRSYSETSLEPNRASPPQNEALDSISVISFASMAASHQNLDTKADMMSSLLSMLGTHDPDDMARTLLAMSSSADSCAAMRQSGCIPLLVQLLHNENYQVDGINWGARQRAGLALHNIVHSNIGDRRGKREIRVLRLLEIIRTHSEAILSKHDENYRSNRVAPDMHEHGPGPAVAAIMKLSFEEDHKNTICDLGGLQTVGEILAVDYMANKECNDPYAIALRKYAGMILINLTYNDAHNKTVLCSMTSTLQAIIGQLRLTGEEDLIQVFAGIIRNISWRPDQNSQRALQNVNAVRALMICIQKLNSEVCIRPLLSAIWNLSAHNSENKEEICRTPGSLKFLAKVLNYRSVSNSIVVAENAGGILRNISSHIAVNVEYRKILRQEGCLQTLVAHLRSPSTRVVSNACGVLWNLSARCLEDQELLWDLGAVSILKTLIHSKHKSISASSAAALRNLLAVKPGSGTDTESHASFHHQRSNSLPSRTQHNRDNKVHQSTELALRKRPGEAKVKNKVKSEQSQFQDNRLQYAYQHLPTRTMIDTEESPPTYNEATSEFMLKRHARQMSYDSEDNNYVHGSEQQSAPLFTNVVLHKSLDSSSSSSSFSPNDNSGRRLLPFTANESSDSKANPDDKKLSQDSDGRKCDTNSVKSDDIKPYEDCKLSVAKDVVMIYVGTPKLPIKLPKKEKKHKQLTPKLVSKFKRNPLKKSKDTLCSKDSLFEKSDVEKVSEKAHDEKKENIWVRTKELKQRLLHKSHSSDLAFDKNVLTTNVKKSPFDIYSMSNFPDRVASDQCLSVSDRWYRDELVNQCEMHHGSWSSCDISNDERVYPKNSHNAIIAAASASASKNSSTGSTYSPQINNEYYNRSRNLQPVNRHYHSNQNVYSTVAVNQDSVEDKKPGKTKKGLLKIPLRKISDSSNKLLKTKKSEKKSKKKSEERD